MARIRRAILSLSPAAPQGSLDASEGRLEALPSAIRTYGIRFAMVWVLIALSIVSDILYPGFFAIGNVRDILTQNAPEGLVALGMTFVIIAGGFDLSVAATYAAAGVAFASFSSHMPVGVALILALLVGVVAGCINGVIITRLRVNPFVATLGTSSVFAGLALMYSHSEPVVPTKTSFGTMDATNIAGIPSSIVIFFGAFIIGSLILSKSVFGRSIYAVGGNAEAARLAGIRVERIRFVTYVITGLCAAVAGAIIASRTGVGQADIGTNVTLDSIAMVIIGGTSLLGGEGAMWRTLVGLLILATINNLFDSLALSTALQELVKGAIVVGAVALDSRIRNRR
jgi:ribose transport system permease protein